MAQKRTQKEMFGMVISALKGEAVEASVEEMTDFLSGRIEALDKKSSAKKPTKVQEENEVLKAKIVEVLTGAEPMTVSDILKSDEAFADLSNQKVSALARQLVEAGALVKTVDKKKSYFSAVEA